MSEGITWNSEIYGVTAGAIAFADHNDDGYETEVFYADVEKKYNDPTHIYTYENSYVRNGTNVKYELISFSIVPLRADIIKLKVT